MLHNSILIKVQLDATVSSLIYFTAKSLYMFRVSTHPSSGGLSTITAVSGTGWCRLMLVASVGMTCYTIWLRSFHTVSSWCFYSGISLLPVWYRWISSSCFRALYFNINKSPTRCISMQSDLFYCRITLHVSGVTAPIIRSAKSCKRGLRYRS